MTFTIQNIQALREKTGAGMMDCKNALTKANGNLELAENELRERGMIAVVKKAERVSADGIAYAAVIGDKAVLLEINTETDFAGKSAGFTAFVENVARVIAEKQPVDTKALLQCGYPSGGSVEEAVSAKVLAFGENIRIRRFEVLSGGFTIAYMHLGGRVGAILRLSIPADADADALLETGRELAMQIAAMNPKYVSRDNIPAETLAELERSVSEEMQVDPKLSGKPQAVLERIRQGKIDKFCREQCLLEQAYIKEETITVGQHIRSRCRALGFVFEVGAFYRFEKGDGLQAEGETSNEAFAKQMAGSK